MSRPRARGESIFFSLDTRSDAVFRGLAKELNKKPGELAEKIVKEWLTTA